jgi:hypothetical protein
MVRLLHDLDLRPDRVVSMNLAIVDLAAVVIQYLGRRKSKWARFSPNGPSRNALEDRIQAWRGTSGQLLLRLERLTVA